MITTLREKKALVVTELISALSHKN